MSSGLMREHRVFFGDELLVGHVHGHVERRGRCALAGPRLQHVKRAVLDGELHVLHVAVVFLKFFSNFFELPVDLGHQLLHFGQVHRRADARDHVLALGVDQIVAIENASRRNWGRA